MILFESLEFSFNLLLIRDRSITNHDTFTFRDMSFTTLLRRIIYF